MQIQWLGNSCFKIQVKNNAHETLVLTDPYSPKSGLGKGRFSADLVIYSQEKNDLLLDPGEIKGTEQMANPFIIKSPGEYELQSSFVYGLPHSSKEKNTLYVLSIEDIKIAFLGLLDKKDLSSKELEAIEGVDILLIPVGGKNILNAADAAKLVNEIEPRIIIPMCYKTTGTSVDFETVDRFVKEMGNKKEELDKLKISKKDLPQEETRLILLNI
ncbi:MBL fold metallo-hydrolase [Candidatus Kuenenbacteria bacterium]|nr:MBL fold metallo-hydrolase [Candidatus Kuenenbacteria bacterium]